VDIVAVKDEIRYAIQCKCYSSDLGNKPVQEVYAGKEMYGCQVGVVMTNRHFTSGAKELAERTRVLLWDREKLIELLENKTSPAV
jgi:restriction system protein